MSLTAYIAYFVDTAFGNTRPNRATWAILTLIGALISENVYAAGGGKTFWISLCYVIGPMSISLLSVSKKRGSGGWQGVDKWCLLGAVTSILFRMCFSSQVALSLGLNLLIDFFGLVPTIKKAYLVPDTEDRMAWAMEFAASAINVGTVNWLNGESIAYAAYLFCLNGLIAYLAFRRR